jgi:hypothetical protein
MNWTADMITTLLDQVQGVLPRGTAEWERVTENYNTLRGEAATVDRIRNKFSSLVGTRKPTGQNTKPEHVTRAQLLEAQIQAKAAAGLQDGSDDDEPVDALDMVLGRRRRDDSDEAGVLSPSDSSSPSPSPSPPPHSLSRSSDSFPTERSAAMKKAKVGTEILGAAQVLGASLSSVMEKAMELQRDEMQLAREQLKALQEQSMVQQRQFTQLLTVLSQRMQ